jgi:hypothetical protein
MNDFPVIVGFRGLPASAALEDLVRRQARGLALSMRGLDCARLEARVERRCWPSRPPTVQVALAISLPQVLLTAQAGDFGCISGFTAVETAFGALRGRLARLSLPAPAPRSHACGAGR